MAVDSLVVLNKLKTILTAFESSILKKVKDMNPQPVEPKSDDIPSLFIYGTMPTEKTYVQMEMEYVSKTDHFKSFIYAKLQGNSTLEHPKKNLTISLFKDEERRHPLYKNFKGWGKYNTFVLKADYIDILHARNVVSAKLWSKMVESRSDYESLPLELRNSPNNGAIDGFPVKIYVNKEYQGIYNLTIPKCAWMFGMSENNSNHALVSAEINDNGLANMQYNPCNFNMEWTDGEYKDAWEIEVGNDRSAIMNSVNNIIDIIINADDATIKSYLESVLDINSAIDYFLFQDVILGIDGLAKNMLMATYDMNKWYLSAYDMDSTFDLSWEGELLEASDMSVIAMAENKYSELQSIVNTFYVDEMCERYNELRNTILSDSSIIGLFDEYISIYGDDLYIQDTIPFPNIPSVTENNLNHLKLFIMNRCEYLDNTYGYGGGN